MLRVKFAVYMMVAIIYRCNGVGGSWERLPTTTPRNLFVHVTKTDTGLVHTRAQCKKLDGITHKSHLH